MRLIDVDSIPLKEALKREVIYDHDRYIHVKVLEWMLENAPTVDPVRHGKWKLEWETEDTRMLRCSECRMVFNVGKGRDGNYCPNCGARMDGERKEE